MNEYYSYKLKNQDGRPIYGELVEFTKESQFTGRSFAIEDAKLQIMVFNMACPVIEVYSFKWCSNDWRLIEVLELKYVPQWISKEPSVV